MLAQSGKHGTHHNQLLHPGADGIHRSEVFPGLWLDAAALMGGDMQRVAEVAGRGTASPEHAAFVAALRQRAGQ